MSIQRVSMYYAKCDAAAQVNCQHVGPETMEGPRVAVKLARQEGWIIGRDSKLMICPECQEHGATFERNNRGVLMVRNNQGEVLA